MGEDQEEAKDRLVVSISNDKKQLQVGKRVRDPAAAALGRMDLTPIRMHVLFRAPILL